MKEVTLRRLCPVGDSRRAVTSTASVCKRGCAKYWLGSVAKRGSQRVRGRLAQTTSAPRCRCPQMGSEGGNLREELSFFKKGCGVRREKAGLGPDRERQRASRGDLRGVCPCSRLSADRLTTGCGLSTDRESRAPGLA